MKLQDILDDKQIDNSLVELKDRYNHLDDARWLYSRVGTPCYYSLKDAIAEVKSWD